MEISKDHGKLLPARPAELKIVHYSLKIPEDLTVSDADSSFIITNNGAEKIASFLRSENGRNSASVLSAFISLLTDKNIFSSGNFESGTVSKILSRMILFDLQDSDCNKLISQLDSDDNDLSLRSAKILICHAFGPAYKDPKLNLICRLISNDENSECLSFADIVQKIFNKEKILPTLISTEQKIKKDLDDIVRIFARNPTKFRAVKDLRHLESEVTKHKKIVDKLCAERKNQISSAVIAKKPKNPEIAPKRNDSPTEQQKALPTTPNLDSVRKALKTYGSEAIDITDNLCSGIKRKPDLNSVSELSARISQVLRNPAEWRNISNFELAATALSFVKKIADKGPIAADDQLKVSTHLVHIAECMNAHKKDAEIISILVDKNIESQNILAACYMLQIKDQSRLIQALTALSKLEYDKKILAARFNLKTCKSALQICRTVSQGFSADSADRLIKQLSLPFDSEDLG